MGTREWTKENIVKDIETLIIGNEGDTSIDVPEISITDDIGESEGFQELINAKLYGASGVAGYSPEINSDPYKKFEPGKAHHTFTIDYKYKDMSSISTTMRRYESVNDLYGYSQSFDAMSSLAIEDGAELRVGSLVKNYRKMYDSAVSTLKKKDRDKIDELISSSLISSLDQLNSLQDLTVKAIAQPVISPSTYRKNTMIISYGPYYGIGTDGRKGDQHPPSGFGIDIVLTRNDQCISITDGKIIQIKKTFDGKSDRLANFIKVQTKDSYIITYKHVSGKLKEGSNISAGAVLGKFDDSGFTKKGNPVGAHLHMEISKDGEWIKPIPYIASVQPKLKMVFHKSDTTVGLSVGEIFRREDIESWNIVNERAKIVVNQDDTQPTGDTSYSTYIIEGDTNGEVRSAIESVLKRISGILDIIMQDVIKESATSIYKIYTHDFSRKIEDININIVPGSSAKILMQGETAPAIQSTGGRTKSAAVTFIVHSVDDLARLSMLFRVVNSTDHQISMLLMTRSAYKGGKTKTRLRHITEYMLQDTFEKSIKNIIGKKLSPRFDEPVVITNEFLNALGITTCIPTSFEVKTVDENPGTFNVIINFNAINLGNRNLENLKLQKTGSDIPLLPLSTRLAVQDGDSTEKSTVLDEKRLLSSIGMLATKQAMAEFMPIYIISKIKRFKDNIETMAAITDEIDFDDALTTCFLLSQRGYDENMATMNSIIDDIYYRDMSGDASTAAHADTAVDAISFILSTAIQMVTGGKGSGVVGKGGGIINKIKELGIDDLKKLKRLPEMLKSQMKEVANKWGFRAQVGGTMLGIWALTNMDTEAEKQNVDEQYINMNLLSLLPVFLQDLICDYYSHIKDNTIQEFILTCAADTVQFINNISRDVVDEAPEEYTVSDFSKIIKLKSSGDTRPVKGIRLFINAFGYSLDEGAKDAEEKLIKAATRFSQLNNGNTEDLIERLIHLASLGINYWGLEITKEIKTYLIDEGGSGMATAVWNSINPENDSQAAMSLGLYSVRYTANLILNSSPSIYVDHIIEAINGVVTSTYIDFLVGNFLVANTNNTGFPVTESQSEIHSIHLEKIKHTQNLGHDICRKYDMRQEVLSGCMVTNSYPSPEVRQFTGYSGMIIMQILAQVLIGGLKGDKAVDGIEVDSIHEIMSSILPSKSKTILLAVKYISEKTWETLKNTNYIELVIILVAIGIVAYLVSIGAIPVLVGSILTVILSGFQRLVEYGGIFIEIIKDLVTSGTKVILRKGNLLKISVYLTTLIRSGVSHSTLMIAGYETKIWFKGLLTFGEDINDKNGTTYIDFPVFTYLGEAMMPDFWVSKIGYLGDSLNDLVTGVNTITELTYESQKGYSMDDYKQLWERFRDRLTGIDNNAITKAEVELYNILRNSIKAEYAEPYFSSHMLNDDTTAEKTAAIQRAGEYISRFGQIANSYIGRSIGRETYSFKSGFVYVKVYKYSRIDKSRQELARTQKTAIEESRCALTVEVYPDRCKITRNQIFDDVVRALNEAKSQKIDPTSAIKLDSVYSKIMIEQAVSVIMGLFSALVTASRAKTELLEALKSDTVNNLLMLRTMVGSVMGAVGRPGISNMKTILQEDSMNMAKSALYLRSGYLYPTLKLFFIEEDDESYYLFDDLYSYASIIDFNLVDDLDSPMQLLQLTITNIFGNLDDVSSDRKPEFTFSDDHDPSSNLNSMMLKIGCKIKLQTGYSTILDEKNTIFTGRISNIQFGEITRIEATSMGDSLLEEVSFEKVKTYGKEIGQGDNDWLTGMMGAAKSAVTNVADMIGLMDGTYDSPLRSIKNIVGYVLTDATLKGKLDDYTISPELKQEFDKEVKVATNSAITSIKNKFFPNVINQLFDYGGINTDVSINKQMFENINITNTDIGQVGGLSDILFAARTKSTIWVSLNDTVWDILQEINMLIPNNIIRVLPFETRSTIVWGNEHGYYRYRRSSDYDTMVSTSLADKLRFNLGDVPKFQKIMDNIKQNYEYGNKYGIWEPFEAGMAILLLIIDHANEIAKLYLASRTEKPYLNSAQPGLDISNTEHMHNALKWIYVADPGTYGGKRFIKSVEILMYNHKKAMSSYNELINATTDDGALGKIQAIDIDDADCTELVKTPFHEDELLKEGRRDMFLRMVLLEFAAEYYFSLITKTAESSSNSYRRISRVHMKVSGRDIISNNITLMEAYNATKVSFPASTDIDDVMDNTEDDDRSELLVPIHYKLEPRIWKVYSTFFRNINIFPSARNSVLAMYAVSTMTNLIKQSYGGSITIFGDPNIKAGDKVYIYDENYDMYGFVEVRKIVTMFSQEQGYISVITPGMIAKNDSSLNESMIDIFGNFLETAKYLTYGAIAIGFVMDIWRKTKSRENVSKMMDYIYGKLGRTKDFANRIKNSRIGNTIGNIKNKISQIDKRKVSRLERAYSLLREKNPKAVDDIFKGITESRLNVEKLVSSEKAKNIIHNEITKTIKEYAESNKVDIDITDITSEHILEMLARSSDEIFRETNKFDINISKMVKTGIDKEIAELIKKKIPGNVDAQNDAIKKIMDAIDTGSSKDMADWATDLDKGYIELCGKTTPDGIAKALGDTNIDGINKEDLIEAIQIAAHSKTYAGRSMFSEILEMSARTAVKGLAAFTVFSAFDAGREIADLTLRNELTSNNVTITPLFFRGEPFVSNLDGMDKADGKEAGMWDIMTSRASSAFKGITSAVSDPMSDLLSNYDRVMRETLGASNLLDRDSLVNYHSTNKGER